MSTILSIDWIIQIDEQLLAKGKRLRSASTKVARLAQEQHHHGLSGS